MRGTVVHYLKSGLTLIPVIIIITIIFGIIGPSAAQANPGWYNVNWLYRKKITLNAANVTATQNNIPYLISLASDANLAAHARSDGYDILFTASDETTKLAHEIESYNGTTGKLVTWVKIPTLSSVTNTDIYMYYGNAAASNQQNPAGVWDSNFKMVQHLEEKTGGANAIKDSTAYGNNGTDQNSPTLGVNGQIDGAISFNKSANQYIQLPASSSIITSGNFTVEAWFTTTTNHPAYGVGNMEGRIINLHYGATAGTAVSLYVEQNMVGFLYYTGATPVWNKYTTNYYDGNPHQIMMTRNATTGTYLFYYDGVQVSSNTTTFGGFGSYPAYIGDYEGATRSFNGTIDEVRISNIPRSATWIQTSYNNQRNPASTYTLGPEQTAVVIPTAATDNATAVQETNATLNGILVDDGGGTCQYSFEWGTSPGVYTSNTSWTGAINTGATFTANLTGLTKGQPYYYRANVLNSAGVGHGAEVHFLTKPDPPVTFTATTISSSQIELYWTNAASANKTMVRGKLGSFPASTTDGYLVYFGSGTSASDLGLSANTTYFYAAWSEAEGSQQFSNTSLTASATTNSITPPIVIGGKVFSVDKAVVLAPWIVIGAGAAVVIVRGIQYVIKKTRTTKDT